MSPWTGLCRAALSTGTLAAHPLLCWGHLHGSISCGHNDSKNLSFIQTCFHALSDGNGSGHDRKILSFTQTCFHAFLNSNGGGHNHSKILSFAQKYFHALIHSMPWPMMRYVGSWEAPCPVLFCSQAGHHHVLIVTVLAATVRYKEALQKLHKTWPTPMWV